MNASIDASFLDAIDLALTQTEVACRAGCDHCCHYVIRATGAEMLLIKQHLVNTASPTTLKTVMDRARANVQAGKGLDIEQLTPIAALQKLNEFRQEVTK